LGEKGGGNTQYIYVYSHRSDTHRQLARLIVHL
jgi:hypothetical protein